jgi:hypothetical protein
MIRGSQSRRFWAVLVVGFENSSDLINRGRTVLNRKPPVKPSLEEVLHGFEDGSEYYHALCSSKCMQNTSSDPLAAEIIQALIKTVFKTFFRTDPKTA